MTAPPLVLIGESNPYGADPRFALFDEPPSSAGGRLRRKVLGMSHGAYMTHTRINLLQGSRWSAPAARDAARFALRKYRGRVLVLLGRKVGNAFGGIATWEIRRLPVADVVLVSLPHPSGLCRLWQEPGAYQRARDLIAEASPGTVLG